MISPKRLILDIFEILFIGTGIFLIVSVFAGQLLKVTGDSMLPTFKNGEQLIAEKISINMRDLERGEVVIFMHPEEKDKLLIKRVVGLPGESIKIQANEIYINNQKLNEGYLKEDAKVTTRTFLKEGVEYTIPENSYILLGDNRENSADSREWGPIKKEKIVGRAFLVYYPIKNARIVSQNPYIVDYKSVKNYVTKKVE